MIYKKHYYPVTLAKLDRAREMLDDGCSFKEIKRTLGMSSAILTREFPGRGWTQSQGGTFGMLMRKMYKELK